MPDKEKIMNCTICGYQYDQAMGDPENGIPAGTSWEDIDENWLCPDCQMPKEDFEEVVLLR